MKSPGPERTADTRFAKRRNDVITQMVQELLQVAAQVNHRSGATVYLPETFLTRW